MSTPGYRRGWSDGRKARAIRDTGEDYDSRWDFVDAAGQGRTYLAEYERGWLDGYDGKERA